MTESLQCARELSELAKIVSFMDDYFAANELDASIRQVVDLATEELFVNMVQYNTETTSAIDIQIAQLDNGVQVSLTDYGVDAFDPTRAGQPDVTDIEVERTPGGLGIFLVLKMVDAINYQYRDRVSTITFEKHWEMD